MCHSVHGGYTPFLGRHPRADRPWEDPPSWADIPPLPQADTPSQTPPGQTPHPRQTAFLGRHFSWDPTAWADTPQPPGKHTLPGLLFQFLREVDLLIYYIY